MSDSEHTTFTFNVSKTHNFLDLPRETGTYRREVANGVVYTLTVEDGKIVKHEAVDRNGKPLRTTRIRMERPSYGPGYGPIGPDEPRCMFCTSGGDTWGPGGDEPHECQTVPCDM
jgi:hypothetical protein